MNDSGASQWKSRLAGQVFEKLRADIICGALPPGTHMAEVDICERMQVSRTPVREALIRLVEEGLVQVYPQLGSFVAPISIEAVREGQYVREHLECAMVADAARRMTAEASSRLKDNLTRQKRAARAAAIEEFHALDNAFHALIAELSGHPGVWHLILQAETQFDRVRHLSLHEPEQLPRLIRQHEAVARALADGHAAQAEKVLRQHLREVLRTIDRLGETGQTSAVPHRRPRAPRSRKAAEPSR
jgi:GntR family transcriptional regulator, rspAB operon transcriptional repressor